MSKPNYTSYDRFEFMNPPNWHEEQLRDFLMQIWLNRNFIDENDLKKLEYMSTKGLFKMSKGAQ